uniref:Reverse transcriptase domain-containing protein n=1 Tax=Tanacetum cinerariifolium TaxID=118510 RepID=A0A6L2MWU4_TANCI|nr:hypothetical protein [Tanacetum cinerariifolium]
MFGPSPPASGGSFRCFDKDPGISAATAATGRRPPPAAGHHRQCRRRPPRTTRKLSVLAVKIEAVDSDGHLRSCPRLGVVDGGRRTRSYDRLTGPRRIRVGIILAGRLKDNVVRVTRISDMIMAISVVIKGETANAISAYVLQVGLRGYLNGHIGAAVGGYTGVHGGFGFGDRNEEGCTILEFDTAHELVVANFFFKKRDAHLITFESRGHNTQIDYLLVHRADLRACKDCRAYSGEACSSQHRLVIVDVLFERRRHRMEATGRPRILWKNLKWETVETFKATIMERLAALEEVMSASGTDQMWNTLARVMKDAAKESLGVANEMTRTHSTHRESWWLCEEVQTKVTLNQSRFKKLLSCREGNQEDIDLVKERYKVAKREAKIAVANAKDKAYKDLYNKLNFKEGVAIRPAMLYGSECWPITKAQATRVEVAELRMLRWICVNKMREGRLRWFWRVKRRPQNAPVRRVKAMEVEGSRRRGRPKLRWEDRLKMDMKELLLFEDMTSDRNALRDKIRISG